MRWLGKLTKESPLTDLHKIEPIRPQASAGEFDKVGMMGEEQNLGGLSQMGKGLERIRGPVIVEMDEQIVEDHGHRFVILEMQFETGET